MSRFFSMACRERTWPRSSASWPWAGSPRGRLPSPPRVPSTLHPSCLSPPSSLATSSLPRVSSFPRGASLAPSKSSNPLPRHRDSCISLHPHRWVCLFSHLGPRAGGPRTSWARFPCRDVTTSARLALLEHAGSPSLQVLVCPVHQLCRVLWGSERKLDEADLCPQDWREWPTV